MLGGAAVALGVVDFTSQEEVVSGELKQKGDELAAADKAAADLKKNLLELFDKRKFCDYESLS